MTTRTFWRHAALALVAGALACGDSEGPGGDPAEIELLDGNGQTAVPSAALAAPLRVLVTDADGAPLNGVEVEWEVVLGSGSVPASSVTADDGVASAAFTLGAEIGQQSARAVLEGVAGSPVTFTATASVAGASGIKLMSVTPVPAAAPFVHDTYVRDGIAFMFAWDEGVRIFDVGNGMAGGTPAIPKQVGVIITGTANAGTVSPSVHNGWWFHNPVTSEKRYLFVGQEGPGSVGSSSSGDIHVVDVSNLAAPVEVEFYHHPDQPDATEPTPVNRKAGVHNFWMDEPNQILQRSTPGFDVDIAGFTDYPGFGGLPPPLTMALSSSEIVTTRSETRAFRASTSRNWAASLRSRAAVSGSPESAACRSTRRHHKASVS